MKRILRVLASFARTGALTRAVIALLAGFSVGAAAADPSELLDPQDAFRLSVGVLDARTAEVEFRIAKGYYLYRDRFRFETASGRVIAEAKLPAGEMKQDAFFGNSVTYRDHVRIRVPLSREDLALGRTRLKVISQDCADVGVCYVPQEQWVEVKLGAASGSKVSPR